MTLSGTGKVSLTESYKFSNNTRFWGQSGYKAIKIQYFVFLALDKCQIRRYHSSRK